MKSSKKAYCIKCQHFRYDGDGGWCEAEKVWTEDYESKYFYWKYTPSVKNKNNNCNLYKEKIPFWKRFFKNKKSTYTDDDMVF